jgi:hypothetical protein
MAEMHEIDFKVLGEDLQYVEVELDPNEPPTPRSAARRTRQHSTARHAARLNPPRRCGPV